MTAFAQPAADDFSTKALLKAVSAYVADYQRQFAFIVADERTTQEARAAGAVVGQRFTVGELFITYLDADRAWANVHDVASVDGRPREDRDDLRALLAAGSFRSVGRELASRNARFNIGSITRNFNEPMFAFGILAERRIESVAFDVTAVDRNAPGGPVATLSFRERERPTLVTRLGGGSIYARGSFLVETRTGRVRVMRLVLDDAPVHAELETVFVADDGLGLWLPSSFTERYSAAAGGKREETICVSAYSNYRRFDTRSRIK